MPRIRVVVLLLLLLSTFGALAQQVEGRLLEVRVEGTTNYADIVRTLIISRPGTAVDTIDLEAERNRVYSLGTFETVTVAFETTPAGPVLVVRVRENPRIGEIEFEGVSAVPQASLLDALRSTNLLEPGRVLNTARAEESLTTIRQLYRQAGLPYDVDVVMLTELAPDLAESADAIPVRLIFQIDETAEINDIRYQGNTVLTDADLDSLFVGLDRLGEFEPQLYAETLRAVSTRYDNLGYRSSGVDTRNTELQDGVLTVVIVELVIDSIDTTALGVDPAALELQPGDLFNFDTLLEDVKRLARGRSSDIQLQAGISASGGVRVTFRVGAPETAGPVEQIVFEGNTVLSDERLRAILSLQEGDTFTSFLAEEDFGLIVRAYQQAGYRVVTQSDYSYDDGVYVQRVTELMLEGYELQYEGDQGSTQASVITRYLPEPGTVVNDQHIISGLREVASLGVVEVVNYALQPGSGPNSVTVIVQLRKSQTGELRPAAQYATDTGFSASLSYSEKNFLGLAHTVGAQIDVLNTDLGIMLGGSLNYDIPWLYIDALDFKEVPTTVSASVFSLVNNNITLSANGETTISYPGLAPDQRVRVGEYTTRSSGFGVSVGRPVAPFTYLTVSGRGAYAHYMLEPPRVACEIEGGQVTNGDVCSLPFADALQYLPLSGLSAFTNVAVDYDNRDNANFPTEGINAYGTFGIGFGNDMLDPGTGERAGYIYEQVTGGVRSYLQLSEFVPEEVSDPGHVFAVRFDVGHQFGGLYPVSKRFLVGRTNDFGPQIRGYTNDDFNLSRTYATSSLEYRYDFNLSTFATQTVIALAFVDVGWASSVPGFNDYQTPVFAGAGIGVQVNLGFSGVVLPAIRLDYAFSERHPRGVFSFRVGPVF
ncbi:MAG: POTRA domain-containing protein [Trueperaceae bacterium]